MITLTIDLRWIGRLRRRLIRIDPHAASRALIGFVFIGMGVIAATLAFVAPATAAEFHHLLSKAAHALP